MIRAIIIKIRREVGDVGKKEENRGDKNKRMKEIRRLVKDDRKKKEFRGDKDNENTENR